MTRRRARFRPQIEILENRALPCTINWINDAGGLWHLPANWDLERVPAAEDDVCVADFDGNLAVTHSQGTDTVRSLTNAEALIQSGGSLILADSSALTNLTLSSGTLTGAGNVSVSGRIIWTGGTMSGTGTTQLEAGGELNFTGGAVTLGRSFNNAGTVTVLGLNSVLTLAAGTVFNNQEGGLFHIRNNQPLNGSGTFNNQAGATFLRSTATDDVRVGPRLNNDGILELQGGLLLLTVGGSHNGTFLASPNGQFRFNGTHVLQAGSSVIAARVSAVNAGVTVHGSYEVSRGTTVFAAAMTFTPAATVTNLGDEFYVYNGTADLSSGEDHVVPVASFSGGDTGGNLTGSDRITVTEHLTWYTGRMSGSGTLTVQGVLELSPFRNVGATLARTLNNQGTATYSGHFGGFSIASQGVFNNLSGATFDFVANQPQIGGSGVFNNGEGATFRLLFDEALLPWRFNNSGLVELQRGRLVLRNGGSHRGEFVGPAGTLFDFAGGTHDLQSASRIAAASVQFSAGAVNVSGSYDVSGVTTVIGSAVVTFNPGAVVKNLGDAPTVRGGVANFNSGEPLVVSRFRLSGGTLAGSDDLSVLDSFTWSGGSMIGSGITASFGEVDFSGVGMTLGRTFVNYGTVAWTGVGNMSASPGAVFHNAGTFNAQNDQSFTSSCQASFINEGTFQKTTSYGTTTIGLVFSGEGTVDVQTGTVAFPCGAGPGGGSPGTGDGLQTVMDGNLVDILRRSGRTIFRPDPEGW